MNSFDEIELAIKRFEGVTRTASGYPLEAAAGPPIDAGWVKFKICRSELGWRTLEFLAWVINEMYRAGERLKFFPTAPAPYLNTPGDCLSFVIECHTLNDDSGTRFKKVAEFINWCHDEHWSECSLDLEA